MRLAKPPIPFASADPAFPARPAPDVGEHGSEILREAGVDTATIDRLEARNAAQAEMLVAAMADAAKAAEQA